MVLGASWEDSGLCADSSVASGLEGPPSVTGRADKRGRLMSAVNLRPLQVSLGALERGWLISHTPPTPSIPRQRKQRLREEHISGKIHLTANQSRRQGGEWSLDSDDSTLEAGREKVLLDRVLGLATAGPVLGTQSGDTGASSVAQVLALSLNPGRGAGVPCRWISRREPSAWAHKPIAQDPWQLWVPTCAWWEGQDQPPSCSAPCPAGRAGPAPTSRALTWAAGAAVILQREAGEAGAAVGAHRVDAQVLAQLPREEQALVLVVARQAVGQLGLRAQRQGLPARQLCL